MSVAAITESAKNKELELRLDNTLRASMQQTVSDMRTLETDLSKLMITVNGKTASQMLTTLAVKSNACGSELSKLPIIATGLQNTLKFTNQLSSYCITVLHAYNGEGGFPENFDEQIREFNSTAHSVNEQLSALENDVLSGKISLLAVGGEYDTEGMFGSISEDMTEYPSVIFDGPFSDGQARMTPKCERNAVTVEQAAEKLSALNEKFSLAYEINGIIPVYVFESENMSAQVTKNGGILLSLISSASAGEPTLTLEDAAQRAKDFAETLEMGNSAVIWQEDYRNYAVFNFAPEENGVIIYPDIFKVKVALDSGEIIGFEAKSYYMNAHGRTPGQAEITADEARQMLKKGFSPQTERLCIVSVNEKEELCYEFFGTFDSFDYAVYISALDGEEKTSFRIINTDTGKMVI